MPKAVRFDEYGGTDVLYIAEVDRPVPGPGQVLVRVKAAAINPGEGKIRSGLLAQRFPATFPSGEGSDLAGVVDELGPGVTGVAVGDEVIGFTDNRASHAELVVTEAADLVPKPTGVSWEAAGSLYVAGGTAWAMVRAVAAGPGDTVVVAGAAGGVGSIAVQLATNAGATVIGLAGEANHDWLSGHGVIPVTYGEGAADRIRAASGGRVDALLDTVGGDYVELALELGVRPDRIDTIANFTAREKYGVKTDGSAVGGTPEVVAELAGLIDKGQLEIPIAAVYPLSEVRAAFTELERGHTRGKIVLEP
jgi:NADPH:quinone reductase-like Zn-dependent oxidoreductase